MNCQLRRAFVYRVALPALWIAVAGLISVVSLRAQQNPPANNSPQTAPKQDSDNTAQLPFKITSNPINVTTPVTVFDSSGQLVYDVDKDEFQIFDNGVQQDIVDFSNEMGHLSLVVVVETNDSTNPFLDSVRPLAPLFSDLVLGPQGDVAVLTYSDRVDRVLDFTSDGDKLDNVFRGLHGRGGGMHLDDAIIYALSMLNDRPKSDRKVVIVFSDGFNLGSKMSRGEIVKGAMNSNIEIYGLGFSPEKGLWKSEPKDPAPDLANESVARSMPPNSAPTPTNEDNTWDTAGADGINIVGILLGLGEAAKKPIFKDSMIYFSRYSGGQAYTRWGKSTVQQTLSTIATEIHSQYEITYAPPKPIAVGFHTIKVDVRRPGAKVRTRAGWFYQGEPPRGVRVK